ncbi:MAG: sensor histidine kinase [Clostridia bacterium]|nr:sensor histidine kinase [Clostridia bacterium]
MKALRDCSYRVKLLLAFGVSILCVTVVITLALTVLSYRNTEKNVRSHLDLMTEQSLLNFDSETSAIARQFFTQMTTRRIPDFLYALDGENAQVTLQRTREIAEALSMAITANSAYDCIYIRGKNGQSFSNTFADASFVNAASALLETYGEKTYGTPVWVRAEDGQVYLIRDVYHQEPFHFVGKALARIRNPEIVSLGSDWLSRLCTVAFFHGEELVALSGSVTPETEAFVRAVRGRDEQTVGHSLIALRQTGEWQAVGILPDSVLYEMSRDVVRTGLLIGLLGVALGSAAVFFATNGMTKQISTLVSAMDDAAAGKLCTRAPVTSGDEIGQMAAHFNTMLQNNQELMDRVVQEEKKKNKAEYDALEYKYRSLQSQINPHFIYNAMEVVNAMAKLSGQEEICEVVTHISSFFRQNTYNMEKRFIPVEREFNSLREYAYIFRHIYGSVLETPFTCAPEARQALIPTMILQPLLENALVHGVRAEEAVVAIQAEKTEDGRLRVTVTDNGAGMNPETLRRVLCGEWKEEEADGKKKTVSGIGIRNVRDRLILIYGQRADFDIVSIPESGTTVTITLPLVYSEKDINNEEN